MSASSSQTVPGAPAVVIQTAPVSEIDASCRLPLLFLFISAAKWLVIGWVFQLIASIKFHDPNFLADYSWLTYGRVHPAFTTSVIYGFGIQAGLGVMLWLLAQMGAVPLAHRGLVTIGAAVWNLGVTVGVIGILAGDSTGFEYLEMPGYAVVLVFLGYLLIGLFGVVTFHHRRERQLLPSHWYLFTALFWFPWIYSTASVLLITFPVRGMAQAVIAWWFAQNLLVVWFALVGLAAIFYLVPRLVGRDLSSPYTAMFTYWVLVLFGALGGIPKSASVPAWIPALSTVGTLFALVVFIAVPMVVCQSVGCSLTAARRNVPLSFFFFGTCAFAIAGFARAALVLPDFGQDPHFTWLNPALAQLNYYGFFAMTMFGAIYVILPRLLGVGLAWPKLARLQLWFSMIGVSLVVLPLAIGGLVQNSQLMDARVPFLQVIHSSMMFLRVSTLGDLSLLLAHLFFLANVVGLVVRFYKAPALSAYEELTADLFKPVEAKP